MSTFGSLGVSAAICERLSKAGIELPTAIQTPCLEKLPDGIDACVESHTGSGKTLAYALPLIMRLERAAQDANQTVADRRAAPWGMVLVPSAELGLQIRDVLKQLVPDWGIVPLLGGANPSRQIEALKRETHVVIGSLGRVLDLIRQGRLKGTHLRYLVLDEADQLLDDGNRAECETLLKALSPSRQTILCSATFPPHVQQWADQHLKHPVRLCPPEADSPRLPTTLRHLALATDAREKLDVMRRILRNEANTGAIAFHNRAADLDFLARKLKHHQVRVGIIHGGIAKLERQATMRAFRAGTLDLLLATELAARGLDLSRVSLVFNLDFPSSPDQYLNRVGRTARMGKNGLAITLFAEAERFLLNKLEKSLGITFEYPIYREGVVREASDTDHRIALAKARHAKERNDEPAIVEPSPSNTKSSKTKKRAPTKRAIAKGKAKKARKRQTTEKKRPIITHGTAQATDVTASPPTV